MEFPKLSQNETIVDKWIYWFDHTKMYKSGNKMSFSNVSLEEYTVFVAAGTVYIYIFNKIIPFYMHAIYIVGKIIPLRVTKNDGVIYTNAIKWWLFAPNENSLSGDSFAMREAHGSGIIATWRYS